MARFGVYQRRCGGDDRVHRGVLTTLAFLPQVLRSWRTRSTADLSLGTLFSFIAGVTCWIFYGIAIHSAPVVMWNIITLALNLAILAAKLRHG